MPSNLPVLKVNVQKDLYSDFTTICKKFDLPYSVVLRLLVIHFVDANLKYLGDCYDDN